MVADDDGDDAEDDGDAAAPSDDCLSCNGVITGSGRSSHVTWAAVTAVAGDQSIYHGLLSIQQVSL
jgi:hypothetical protein